MPRSKSGKKRESINSDFLKQAAFDVIENNMSIRDAANLHNVTKSTLGRHIKIHRESQKTNFEYSASNAVRMVFTEQEEKRLAEYLEYSARLNYGLTKIEVRTLAYQYANENGKNYPEQWGIEKKAGREWLCGFLKRNDKLSLRKPEATSLSRSTSFNKKNVNEFYAKLKSCLEKYNFQPNNIYNIDETGNTTVHVPPRVIAPKGIKQIGSMTSGERGVNITMIACISAVGNHVPPMLIFPRVHFKDHMLNGAPPGSVGAANPSGWSNEEKFLEFMKHFIQHVKPSKENPVLLLFDNHDSHLSISLINLAKSNGVVMLTFPPHTSHRLQPLDVSVFGPYKTYYNQTLSEWMLQNPGKPITIYQVAEIVGKAYPKAFTQQNIIKGFSTPGIYPFNSEAFGEDEFLAAFVTDRPMLPDDGIPMEPTIDKPGTSNQGQINTVEQISGFISPEMLRPYPKSAPRKNLGGRKKGKTRILTDTPEKNEIEMEYLKRTKKENKGKLQKATKKVMQDDSSDEENVEALIQDSSSEGSNYLEKMIEEINDEMDFENEEENTSLTNGDFVLIELKGKKSVRHYIAEIKKVIDKDRFEVIYLKKIMNSNKFVPNDQIYEVLQTDIIKKLPKPCVVGGSERRLEQLYFSLDFVTYNMY